MSEVSNDFFEWRKNWLFSHCERGAMANAVLYSIIEIAKENMLKPYEYINMLTKSVIAGLVFNSDTQKPMIVMKDILQIAMLINERFRARFDGIV